MATFRKRGNKWQAVVRRGGHPPMYKAGFGTKDEAKQWATSVEDSINKDEYLPSPEAKRRSVKDLLDRYRRTELPKKRDQRNAERHLDFWIDRLGERKLSTVNRAAIVEIRDEMAIDRSPATVNRYLATLRHAFKLAVTDWEWAGRNPCQNIMLREPRGRDRHLSDDEIKRLLKATAESRHPHLHAIVLIALTTGARRGEVTGIRWPDVNLATGRVVLRKTKNDEQRTLALIPQAVEALRALKKVRRIDDDRVFPTVNPVKKRTFPGLEAAWREALATAEVEDFRFHDLRHTFASRMAMDGRTLQEIAAALGHKTLAMVQRYAHLTESHVHTAMSDTGRRMLGDV